MLIMETSNYTVLAESNLELSLSVKGAKTHRKQGVCGELTLKQRWADDISIGSGNASGNHTDLCDKPRILHRQVLSYHFAKAKNASCYVLKRSDLDKYFKVAEYMVEPVSETPREKLVPARTEEALSGPAGDQRDEKDDDASAAEEQESDAGGGPAEEE